MMDYRSEMRIPQRSETEHAADPRAIVQAPPPPVRIVKVPVRPPTVAIKAKPKR